jgi:hypothetical protein
MRCYRKTEGDSFGVFEGTIGGDKLGNSVGKVLFVFWRELMMVLPSVLP